MDSELKKKGIRWLKNNQSTNIFLRAYTYIFTLELRFLASKKGKSKRTTCAFQFWTDFFQLLLSIYRSPNSVSFYSTWYTFPQILLIINIKFWGKYSKAYTGIVCAKMVIISLSHLPVYSSVLKRIFRISSVLTMQTFE